MMKTGYTLLLIWLLAACANPADNLPGDATRYPVSFSLPQIAAMTRATVTGDESALATGTKVTIAAYNPNTQAFVAQSQYKVNANGTGLELDYSSEMFLSAGTYDFCAIVPGLVLEGDKRSGKVAPGVDALGSTTQAQMRAEATTIQLADLKHLASQIHFTARVVKEDSPITTFDIVSIKIDSMVLYTDNQGNVTVDNLRLPENELIIPGRDEKERYTSIEIQNTQTNVTFDYQRNAPEGKSGIHYNIQKEPLIVYPRTVKSFVATITINIAEKNSNAVEKQVSAKINRLAFEPGKRYLFEVNYGWDFVNFAVTVSPWTVVDSDQGQVGSGEQEVGTTFTVDPWGNLVELGGEMGGGA